jgi:hypothetical protein
MTYHILNGDSLKAQFPADISGEIIVAREALLDGEVKANSLEQFFKVRADFMHTHYEVPRAEYLEKSVKEINKILDIPAESEINLWFEDDLFCQVNLWFIADLLFQQSKDFTIYLVRPTKEISYNGFAWLTSDGLENALKQRVFISNDLISFSELWKAYQNQDPTKLKEIADRLANSYPFIPPTVNAQLGRMHYSNGMNEVEAIISKLIDELSTEEFVPIFKAFNKQAGIYGFGDLQVERLLSEVIRKRQSQ